MGVKLYAFAVSAGLAAVAGILIGFRGQLITYGEFNVFSSINSLGHAVIGGLGYVLGAAFAAPNAIGGLGTRVIAGWVKDRKRVVEGQRVCGRVDLWGARLLKKQQ